MPGRALISEDPDPYGVLPNWLTPQLNQLGWEAIPIPSQQIVRLLAPEAYRSLIVGCVEEIRPDIVFVECPLDYLDLKTCEEIRSLGAHIIAWFISAPADLAQRKVAIQRDLTERFDRCFTPFQNKDLLDIGVYPAKWVISPESIVIDDPAAPAHEAVLIAPYNEHLGDFVQSLANEGIEIACYGNGWNLGPVSRVSRLGLYRRANYVIILQDQKIEMLEAATIGAKCLIENHPSLLSLLPPDSSPPAFADAIECATLIKRNIAANKPVSTFTPNDLWPSIIEGMPIDEEKQDLTPSKSLKLIYSSVAHAYEYANNPRAAQIVYELWHRHDPDSIDAILGQARVAMSINFYETAAKYAKAAIDMFGAKPSRESISGYLDYSHMQGDPVIEAWNIRLTALSESDQLHTALDEGKKITDASLARAVQSTLGFDLLSSNVKELKYALNR